MSVLLDRNNRVMAVSATGAYGTAQVRFMRRAGTNLVAHVSPGRGGSSLDDTPVFDTAAEAVEGTGADTAIVYTPAAGARDAIIECISAGVGLAVVGAEFVPVQDSMYAAAFARESNAWIVGPNTVGMLTPGEALMGALSPEFATPGRIGVIGRSGTLTITCTSMLTKAKLGQSTIVHVGGDYLCGRNPNEWLQLFLDDDGTDVIIYLGEIGGSKEYAMLDTMKCAKKPVITMIVGRGAPSGRRMGHAGALIGAERETANAKRSVLMEAGALLADSPSELVSMAKELASKGTLKCA
jgi:succinyl-CoA synthetase alpha subunit